MDFFSVGAQDVAMREVWK